MVEGLYSLSTVVQKFTSETNALRQQQSLSIPHRYWGGVSHDFEGQNSQACLGLEIHF
jgi:hypothetical protein